MSQMNESCHMWMKHVTYENKKIHERRTMDPSEYQLVWQVNQSYRMCEWVMAHINKSCHMFVGHVTHEWVMSHMNEECHVWKKKSMIGVLWIRPSTNWYGKLYASIVYIHIYIYTYIYIHIYVYIHICIYTDWYIASLSMKHVTCMNESRCTSTSYNSWMNVSRQIWTSHVTYEWVMSHMNESCHIWMSHVTYTWLTY